jgi:hypothetical protein
VDKGPRWSCLKKLEVENLVTQSFKRKLQNLHVYKKCKLADFSYTKKCEAFFFGL